MMRQRPHPLRFSIEQAPNGLLVVVDWALGLVAGPGAGSHDDAERFLTWIREYARRHGDAYVLQNPKTLRAQPRFPSGKRPPERPGWKQEQEAILRAYARVAEVVRIHRLSDEQMVTSPDIILARRTARSLHDAALASIGLLGPDGLG